MHSPASVIVLAGLTFSYLLDKTKTMGYIVEPGPQVIATNGKYRTITVTGMHI